MKTAGEGNLNKMSFGENSFIPFNLIDHSQGGSALDGSHPMMTAVSPAAGNPHSLTLVKPHLGKDSIDNQEYFKSVKRPSGEKTGEKIESEDRVIPFNPSMFSPRDGDVTGRGGG